MVVNAALWVARSGTSDLFYHPNGYKIGGKCYISNYSTVHGAEIINPTTSELGKIIKILLKRINS